MSRFVVRYEKPGIEGNRLFDVVGRTVTDEFVRLCAQRVAGEDATIIEVKLNDGRTNLGEYPRA